MKSLAYGLGGLIPDDAPACWGARAILKNGIVDFPRDRCDMQFAGQHYKEAITNWAGMVGMPWVEATAKTLRSDQDELKAFEAGAFHARCNTNASHGYLYVTMWMDAPNQTGETT